MVTSVSSSAKSPDADRAIATDGSQAGAIASGSLVGDYADRLMDDLFDDLEQSLDEGVDVMPVVEAEPVEDETVALTPIAVPQMVLSEEMLPPRVDRAAREKAIADAIREQEREKQSRKSLDRLLVGGALVALVGTMGLWYVNRRGELQQAALETQRASAESSLVASGDAAFVNYMQRSLDTIAANERVEEGGSSRTRQPLPVMPLPVVPLPTGPLQPLPAPGAQASPQPQPPAAAVPDLPLASNLTEAIDRLARLLERLPQPGNGSLPRPSNDAPVESGPVAMESPAPRPSPKPSEGNADRPQPNTVAAAPKPSQSLVGLLDLGASSAALFAIEGVTRRYNIGESIGGSGWTLVEVSADAATIRKDGNTRTIYIGEKF